MANVNVGALLARARALLEDGAGSVRTVLATRFDGGLFDGLPEDEQSRRALITPITQARVVSMRRHEASPPPLHSLALYEIELEVRVVRHAGPLERLDDDTRDALMGAALTDGDVIAQAFGWPGAFSAGTTGVVGEHLIYEGSELDLEAMADDEPGRVVTRHAFRGVVQVTQATS